MRQKMIAGNWKMNPTPSEAEELIKYLLPNIPDNGCETVICVPSIYLMSAVELTKGSRIKVGAQNMYCEDKGAYTGEISPRMLRETGVSYVILGHSERREHFKEDDALINRKLKKAIEYGIRPILCCGESLDVRRENKELEFIAGQLDLDLEGLDPKAVEDVIIAYEPIWAIGTGNVASADQAEEVCAFIRNYIKKKYDERTASEIKILYGGSMNAGNAVELLKKPDIDGGLIGGASLKPEFAKIVEMA